jgi:cytochrome c peroxidase
LPGPAPFDAYIQAILEGDEDTMQTALRADEVAGLRLFIGEAGCIRCHSGPLLTDHSFHNTGVPLSEGSPPDHGRAEGLKRLLTDEFNCLGPYSDAAETDCGHLSLTQANGEETIYAFKTPSLRNIAGTAPYMHTGQFPTLRQVLAHYHQAPPAPLGQTELKPLPLSEAELGQLEAFLHTLSAPLATPPELLKPPVEP